MAFYVFIVTLDPIFTGILTFDENVTEDVFFMVILKYWSHSTQGMCGMNTLLHSWLPLEN